MYRCVGFSDGCVLECDRTVMVDIFGELHKCDDVGSLNVCDVR